MSRMKPGHKSERATITVMLGRDFANRLRVIAGHRSMTMTEAAELLLRPTLDKEYRKVLAEVEREPNAGA